VILVDFKTLKIGLWAYFSSSSNSVQLLLRQHFIVQLTHTTLKDVKLLKHFKIRKLLEHVSVYKETIIREPPQVLS